MEIIDLQLKGLKLVKPNVFKDNRGFFLESFQQPLYQKMGIQEIFLQDNHSFSQKGCIRGMHFQSFPGQAKLVRVAVGKIYDVAVDIRPESPTFGQWEGIVLDDKNHHQLFIPVGFAHGFCVLSQEAHVMYKVSTPYDPLYEKGFRWNDSQVNIQWPIEQPIVSERDKQSPSFRESMLQLTEIRK
ncbi:dTDP-4-dehydrorhamnose 3,5-epimerase [Candidatus Protochlamydia sp. W-9]|uniref:dTDP-4-dehydrorhamnose 3,5-epimerase n=1 Tax=Candidatus Protochlamydia sp. W-9 TaxID=1785087 RepID=UPI00096A7614|nr:dTDP-4-dehydrorhamnose 3,5-epimerase [Candidatus Protochlamydia sp. W-9]